MPLVVDAPSDPATLDWLEEALRDTHGYLGPDDDTYYPGVHFDPDAGTVTIEARTDTGNPIDERSRDAIQTIVDEHDGTPPADIEAERDAHDRRQVNLVQAVATLRQWSDDADGVTVTDDNAIAVVQTVVDRLGIFFDRFADLLENKYGPRE